jgi:hypothetical protein
MPLKFNLAQDVEKCQGQFRLEKKAPIDQSSERPMGAKNGPARFKADSHSTIKGTYSTPT